MGRRGGAEENENEKEKDLVERRGAGVERGCGFGRFEGVRSENVNYVSDFIAHFNDLTPSAILHNLPVACSQDHPGGGGAGVGGGVIE